jgi:hypothetical protein
MLDHYRRKSLYWLRVNCRPVSWHFGLREVNCWSEKAVWLKWLPVEIGTGLQDLSLKFSEEKTPLYRLGGRLWHYGMFSRLE